MISGDLTVNGTTTTVNSTEVSVADKNMVLASGATTDAEANNGGITIKGATDKSIVWQSSTADGHSDSWAVSGSAQVGGQLYVDGVQARSAAGLTLAAKDVSVSGSLTGPTITQINGDISSEATSRSDADAVLQSNIDSEEAARTAADSAESAARQAADTSLQSNIDSEEAARIAADSAESAARQAADTSLQSNIDSEATSRSDADVVLQSNIDSEEAARIAADATESAASGSGHRAAV